MDSAPDAARVCVNGVPLNAADSRQPPAKFDVTRLLKPRNEAVIDTDTGHVQNVRLEVHSG